MYFFYLVQPCFILPSPDSASYSATLFTNTLNIFFSSEIILKYLLSDAPSFLHSNQCSFKPLYYLFFFGPPFFCSIYLNLISLTSSISSSLHFHFSFPFLSFSFIIFKHHNFWFLQAQNQTFSFYILSKFL